MTDTLLPPSRTRTEAAMEAATARVGAVPVPNDTLWDPDTCPAALLPWLAWALSVDVWDSGWAQEEKRATLRESVAVHRRKGTVGSVRAALCTAGYGEVTILEGMSAEFYTGALSHDGAETYGRDQHWAEYRVIVRRPVSIEQAAQIRAVLATVAPARCRLAALDYREAANLYDAAATYDATFTYGVV